MLISKSSKAYTFLIGTGGWGLDPIITPVPDMAYIGDTAIKRLGALYTSLKFPLLPTRLLPRSNTLSLAVSTA